MKKNNNQLEKKFFYLRVEDSQDSAALFGFITLAILLWTFLVDLPYQVHEDLNTQTTHTDIVITCP
jgi:hypothetical protein